MFGFKNEVKKYRSHSCMQCFNRILKKQLIINKSTFVAENKTGSKEKTEIKLNYSPYYYFSISENFQVENGYFFKIS